MQDMVKKSYAFDPKPLGHGASGEGIKNNLEIMFAFSISLLVLLYIIFIYLIYSIRSISRYAQDFGGNIRLQNNS